MQTRGHLISEPAKKLARPLSSPNHLMHSCLRIFPGLRFCHQIASADKALTGYAEALTNGLRELKYAQAKLRTGSKNLLPSLSICL